MPTRHRLWKRERGATGAPFARPGRRAAHPVPTVICAPPHFTQRSHMKPRGLLPLSLEPLPLHVIRPTGWLLNQLRIQANGLSGHLHEFWASIAESGWIGGSDEADERGPHWLDGAVPLAFLRKPRAGAEENLGRVARAGRVPAPAKPVLPRRCRRDLAADTCETAGLGVYEAQPVKPSLTELFSAACRRVRAEALHLWANLTTGPAL